MEERGGVTVGGKGAADGFAQFGGRIVCHVTPRGEEQARHERAAALGQEEKTEDNVTPANT